MIKDTYDTIIADQAEKYSVPFTWIKAIIGAESDFNPDAWRAEPQINDGSSGLMQILLKTARGLGFTGDPSALFDPMVNISLGTKLLAQLRARFGDDFSAVYSAYNSGSPTAYKTNPTVAAHVNRALMYLAEVEASVTTVNGAGPAEDQSGGIDIMLLVGAAALAVWYFFIRR